MHTRAIYNVLTQSRTVQKGGSNPQTPPANHTLLLGLQNMVHFQGYTLCLLGRLSYYKRCVFPIINNFLRLYFGYKNGFCLKYHAYSMAG